MDSWLTSDNPLPLDFIKRHRQKTQTPACSGHGRFKREIKLRKTCQKVSKNFGGHSKGGGAVAPSPPPLNTPLAFCIYRHWWKLVMNFNCAYHREAETSCATCRSRNAGIVILAIYESHCDFCFFPPSLVIGHAISRSLGLCDDRTWNS